MTLDDSVDVAGRHALIIGASTCGDLPKLRFVEKAATDLHTVLCEKGSWTGERGLLIDPTAAEMMRRISSAFVSAHEKSATLLIGYIGHGVTTQHHDFYLLGTDSKTSDLGFLTAVHIVQLIREGLTKSTNLDGLVVLIDACEAGQGVAGAASRWQPILSDTGGRMELLVASDDRPAYDACFTRSILDAFAEGLPHRGDSLLCADLVPFITARCERQRPASLAFNGGNLTDAYDPGLWLVPNAARRRDAVTGRPAAGLVDALTRGFELTDAVRRVLTETVDHDDRLRVLVGGPGSGKSTILALLVRPSLSVPLDHVSASYVSAAVFLDAGSTLHTLATELATQVCNIGEFARARDEVQNELAAKEEVPGVFDLEIGLPAGRLRRRLCLLVDGVDQAAEHEPIVQALHDLTTDPRYAHVKVIVGVRSGTPVARSPKLRHGRRIAVRPPTGADIATALADIAGDPRAAFARQKIAANEDVEGGWLTARLLREIDWSIYEFDDLLHGDWMAALVRERFRTTLHRTSHPMAAAAVASVLAAVGVGTAAPIRLVQLATRLRGHEMPLSELRTTTADLGALIARGNPGQPGEKLGLAHESFTAPLAACADDNGYPAQPAHRAIADVLESVDTDADLDLQSYAASAAPRHHLAAGDSLGALHALRSAETLSPTDNRDRWAAWLPIFEQALGPEHPDTVDAEAQYVRWTGESGDPRSARRMFARQVRALKQVREEHDTQLLTAKEKLADWTGQAGQPDRARHMLERLMPQRRAVSGDRDRATLQAAMDLAFWTGESGRLDTAFVLYDRLLPELDETLGPRHRNTLGARSHYARFLGEAGRPRDAKEISTVILADTERALGADHNDTLWARNNLAWQTGEVDGAEAARALFAVLVQDRERLSGPENHGTLVARRDLAIWTGKAGNAASARDQLQKLLPIRIRNYGSDHQDTLYERDCLAEWTGKAGDPRAAADQYAQLLEIHKTKFGENSDKTNAIRRKLEEWRTGTANNS
jgi:hypothetical protein